MHDRMGGGIRLFFAWSLMAALCLATWMSAPVRAQVAGASLSGTILGSVRLDRSKRSDCHYGRQYRRDP